MPEAPAGIARFGHTGSSRTLRHRAGYRESGRLVRTALRQHAGHVLQHGCHRIYHPVGSLPHLGYLRKLYRTQQGTYGTLVHTHHRHAGYPVLRTRYQLGSYRCHCHCRIVALPPSEDAGSRQREIPRIGTHAEHLAALHHDDCHRIFLVCTYRHPLHRQHADGPELSGGHLHTGRIPGTRAVWHTPVVLWPCLFLASGAGRERRLLRTAHQVQRHEVHPQRRKLRPTKRIRTSKSPDALSTNTPRTCCSRVCTAVPIPQQYHAWQDIKGYDVPHDKCGNMIMVSYAYTQWENIKFFFSHQLNWMYWRYFMWNFAGRQNDIQGSGEIEHGNWITGIPFIDNWLVGTRALTSGTERQQRDTTYSTAYPCC